MLRLVIWCYIYWVMKLGKIVFYKCIYMVFLWCIFIKSINYGVCRIIIKLVFILINVLVILCLMKKIYYMFVYFCKIIFIFVKILFVMFNIYVGVNFLFKKIYLNYYLKNFMFIFLFLSFKIKVICF